jgi:trehalose 6-phosphate phosphatase
MRYILSKSNLEVLDQFAWSNVLLAFDFDGTLAPIVSKPESAVIRPMTRFLLEAVAQLYPCIVLSGRAQTDVLKRLSGIKINYAVGNHGLEPFQATQQIADTVRQWLPALEKQLKPFNGVQIEDKTFSVAIHYRRSREKKKVRAAIANAATSLGEVRLVGGKQVVNILPNGAPHKGIAIEVERKWLHCDTAIYVGDDETDEDVFMLDQPGQLLTIRVGHKRDSNALYYIKNQREINKLLSVLISLRQNKTQRRTIV